MKLKRLELSGFKSFARNTVLEFPSAISGVVGPNGSGKSNVADAIRWVLGEQSIKTLRGKRGEDMIFAGSPAVAGSNSAPKQSRASAVMVFDNSNREFPLEFSEVSIGRRVYRDGANEYLINDSEVRLRDIVELLAKVGFGSTQHHIIGQGEADRILYASPSERREMIEDALGLKIFHLRRAEAERKLEKTEENIRQVQTLQKEIQPHLKFLKSQAEKFQVASQLREELKILTSEYLSRKLAMIREKSEEIKSRKIKPENELSKIISEVSELRDKIAKEEKNEILGSWQDKELEVKLKKVREEEMNALRELGRLEGIIATEERAAKVNTGELIEKKEAEKMLRTIAHEIDGIRSLEMLSELKKMILGFIDHLLPRRREGEADIESKKKELVAVKAKLDKLSHEARELGHQYESEINRARKDAQETRKDEKTVYHLELEAGKLKDVLRAIKFEEEKIKLLEEEYNREHEEAKTYGVELRPASESLAFSSGEEMDLARRKAEKVKVRLEEAGGIDSSIIKEFGDMSARDEYLRKELGDLDDSREKLEEMMAELEERLSTDFKSGISKINTEFQTFFETMFGGGSAALKIIQKTRNKSQTKDQLEEVENAEEGIEIIVDLPRKKVRSLDSLSGGERALTSIALLFAMSAVNPPPFLVLDETDAALDEANSQRYAKMLENLSKTTQLILITHNRNTMKCAGILYGVTMGSDGISKLLSIKFEEAGALVS